MYRFFFKRFLDVLVSGIALLLLSPLLVLLIVAQMVVNKGVKDVFFMQERPGLHARVFRVLKFKTMRDLRDKNGNLLPDAERITLFGKWLRSTSLDELPQLINVFKGDMSLIGPRPLLVQYLRLYNREQARRHEVRPGITGWAQCHGRNAISWTKKFKYDVWYVDNLSFKTDIKIIGLTIKNVIKREGISGEGQVTAEFFNGKN